MEEHFDQQEGEDDATFAARKTYHKATFLQALLGAIGELDKQANATSGAILSALGGGDGETNKRAGQLFTLAAILEYVQKDRFGVFDIASTDRSETARRIQNAQRHLEDMLAQTALHVHKLSLDLTATAQRFDGSAPAVKTNALDFVAHALVEHHKTSGGNPESEE